ncbi:lasso peptide biosynthesis B2 protein [Bacillus sp. USDA818B3_A]|uniref:lasso peptide biosynthesis B2 protein n=1 Tax=Bacillus sp. USDA818B3_A TaxID=2698834 RepID=UPI00136FA768|nr:lasso peptide biosynthesis B2 protein [Bacillus sp. USDA818B3_A]
MDIVRKIRNFLILKLFNQLLLLEAFYTLGWARVLKSLPFAKVAPSLGERMTETVYTQDPKQLEFLQQVSDSISVMSRHTWWESKCLVMAIAGMKMLERRKIESTLYMGMARDDEGNMIAHAWLRSGSFYVSGSTGMERFTIVAKFAKRMDELKVL